MELNGLTNQRKNLFLRFADRDATGKIRNVSETIGRPCPGNGLATPDRIDLTSEEGLQRCNTQAAKVTLPRRAASGTPDMRAVHEPD